MEYAKTTRARVSALLAGILAMLTIAAAPVLGADESAVPVAAAVAADAVAPDQAAGVAPVATTEPQAGAQVAAPVTPIEGTVASTVPADAAVPAVPAPVSVGGTAPAVSGTPPEALPERVETAPVLVGPNDDSLLREVEKHVVIVPAEPAIKIAEPAYDIPMDLNTKVLDYVEIF